jgi:hypothetical protein
MTIYEFIKSKVKSKYIAENIIIEYLLSCPPPKYCKPIYIQRPSYLEYIQRPSYLEYIKIYGISDGEILCDSIYDLCDDDLVCIQYMIFENNIRGERLEEMLDTMDDNWEYAICGSYYRYKIFD